ncbi:carbohydrate kinase [Spirulina sp. CS-785/01]|uniref:carbohydrate kinase family protein n=1 Tax=Spirulina sp. CS-785/01 TaxID=3021716 RepID=UPI00232B6A4B|nr:carbohydrate kinase [Spirulina sp. CS-785/01]MDB9314228.1 carbohydrate kinase [Spirulina sp. CS-785/01]
MDQLRVICFGEILYDYLADQAGEALASVQSWTPLPGGAPGNVACGLAKLGVRTAFLGCVGEDEAGRALISLCEGFGVDCRGVQWHPTAPTRRVYVLRDEGGDRSFAGFGDHPPDQFADAYIQGDALPEVLFQEADYFVFGTNCLAYPQSREAVFQALQWADQHHLKIVLDVNWRPSFWSNPEQAPDLLNPLWEQVDFVKLAKEEALWLWGTADAGVISRRLDSVEGVIVTSGGEAAISYCISDTVGQLDPFSLSVVDTTGAGDGFLAGFLYQLCQQGLTPLQEPKVVQSIIRYGAAVGALTTQKPGAIEAQPTSEEVGQFLATHANSSPS